MVKTPYFYSVVRYMNDPIKNEALNIGVIVQSSKNKFVACKFLKNLRNKLGGTASSVDIDVIREYIDDFKLKFQPFDDDKSDFFVDNVTYLKEDFLTILAKESYGKIQFTDPRGGVGEDLKSQVNMMFTTFVGDENVEKGVKQSRFKTQLKDEFRQRKWLLNKKKNSGKIGIEVDAKINGSKSGVNHVVDFALQNGKLLVIETLDMSKDSKSIEAETYEAAFKIDDLTRGRNDVETISIISGLKGKECRCESFFKILKTYSTNVIKYSEDNEKNSFLGEIGKILE